MCVTLLYATNFLLSLCIRVINLDARVKAKTNRILLVFNKAKVVNRISPKPPSFNISPAKIIEPLVLASTCALGNQKWIPKTGSFTKNGINKITKEDLLVKIIHLVKKFLVCNNKRITPRKGKDKAIVYIIKAMLAVSRSG